LETGTELVFHSEYRVRIAAGKLVGVLFGILPDSYANFQPRLFTEIEASFSPEITTDDPLVNEHVVKGGQGW
jgi:hypothetical protein